MKWRHAMTTTRWRAALLLAGAFLMLAGCIEHPRDPGSPTPSLIDTRGPAAAAIADLWWLMLALATGVFVAVMGLYAFVFVRYRAGHQPVAQVSQPRHATMLVVGGGFVIPLIILAVTIFYTVRTINAAIPVPPETAFTIQVIGRQFWWEVIYPEQGVITANEIRIPVGQPVRVELTTDDVIHSFWVPQLHGKLDMNPGHINVTWLQADEPGIYRGICAEFCGVQHALMAFEVIAEPDEAFAAWLDNQRQPARAPVKPLAQQGQAVFMNQTCVNCHAIRDMTPPNSIGPDLTHVASRRLLGAGTVENTSENLAIFSYNPHEIKPGNLMPAVPLTQDEILALATYLAGLD